MEHDIGEQAEDGSNSRYKIISQIKKEFWEITKATSTKVSIWPHWI